MATAMIIDVHVHAWDYPSCFGPGHRAQSHRVRPGVEIDRTIRYEDYVRTSPPRTRAIIFGGKAKLTEIWTDDRFVADFAAKHSLLLSCLGLALFAYAVAHPSFVPAGETARNAADRLFPIFIMTVLPQGISGLIIAGLLAEAMNSLSSGVSTVVVTDVVGRFRKVPSTPEGDLRASKWISVLIGGVVVLLSMGMMHVSGHLLEVSYKVVNLFVAPLFGLFFMAIFVRWATPFGTLIGAAAGVATAIAINYWRDVTGNDPPISFLWAMPASLAIQIVVGMLASLLPFGERAGVRDDIGIDQEGDRSPSLAAVAN
jgi:Na+/proline symporter